LGDPAVFVTLLKADEVYKIACKETGQRDRPTSLLLTTNLS
jgi:hypothetical protein